ncbi:MAG: SpoIIE family protein phosphatase [Phycisphaeraceae bacterium]|nr:MAG: SpoIIE family protein phosphatase [Phycisphaeraceae bacterium]
MPGRQPSIRTLIALMVTIPMAAVAASLVTLSVVTSRRVAEELGANLVRHTTVSVQAQVRQYLSEAVRVSDLYARRVADGVLPLDGLTAWERPMLDDLLTSPDVASICLGTERGDATWLLRAHGRLEVGRVTGGRNDEAVEYVMTPDGVVAPDPIRIYFYDPRIRPWYDCALKHDGPVWTPIYFWFGEQGEESVTGTGYVRRVSDPATGLNGVLVIDVALGALSSFIATLPMAEVGAIFIIDEQGLLVASSLGPVNSEAGERLSLRGSAHPAARAVTPIVERASAAPHSMHRVLVDDAWARAAIVPLKPHAGIDWRVIAVLPESAFMAEAQAVQQRAILLGLIALAAAMLLGFILSRRLADPLVRLADHVRRVASGDFDSRINLRASRELTQLSAELNDMASGLRQRMELQQSLTLATQVQKSLLPAAPPVVDGIEIAARSRYCESMGGDYFDFVPVESLPRGRLLLVVGDVMGHGIASALLMTTARAALRAAAPAATDLGDAMSRLNHVLASDARHGRFMTMTMLTVDPSHGAACWASAGHDPALLYRPATGQFSMLDGGDIPLGVMPDLAYQQITRDGLRPGDVIILGTDGLWEARNPQGESYGKDRLRQVIQRTATPGATADQIAAAIESDHAAFLNGRAIQDDVTFLIVRIPD